MPESMKCFRELEREFESTLTGELIPGFLHNFANPLNGIMGRSKLLQRKLEISISGNSGQPDPGELYSKIIRDVDLLSRDTDRLSGLLQNVAEKFNAISRTNPQPVNLSEIIAIEIEFFDFYLDFKHNIRKKINLNPDIPEVMGIPADYSLSLWALLRNAMLNLKNCEPKELHISTGYEAGHVQIQLADSGAGLAEKEWNACMDCLDHSRVAASSGPGLPLESILMRSFFLFKKYKAQFRMENENGMNVLTISIPVK
jgi:signal transduction histidine kinase